MENKQGGTAGILIPSLRGVFPCDIDSEGERHSGRDVFSVLCISGGQIKFKGKEGKNMKITLKDGSSKEYQQPMSVYDIALDISEGLARMATAGEADGEVVDLRTIIDHDCELSILTFNDEKGKGAFRHTASHIMAQAVKRLYPETKLAIGPSIADGFYYDVDRETPFTAEDLEKIEAEMKKIVKENLEIKQYTMPRNEAIEYFKEKNEDYKVELIEDLPEDETISFY